MPLTLNNTNTLTADNIVVSGTDISQIYATKTELDEVNNTADITANTDAIAVLNTKQLQNFNSINAINTDLTNNYQTNTVLATNFYNKTEIDTTFTNYYTSSQVDTNLSTNYQTNAQLSTNYYNKSEIDANNWIDATALTPYALTSTLTSNYYTITQTQANYYDKTYIDANIGGGGYTDTEIDNLLALRVPLSDFTNRFSANPIIDCSAPTVIHSGLTLNNSTINVSPVAGLLFSNETGGGDKVVSQFKNATNYITIQGNKIIANATSDDSLVALDLNPSDSVKIQNLTIGDITVPVTGSDIIRNSGDANYTLRVRDTQGVWEFKNRNFRCMNPSNPANGTEMILHDTSGDYRLRIGSQTTAQVGIGVQYNASYFLNVGGVSNFNQARVANDSEIIGNLNLTNITGDIQLPTTGVDMFRNSGDSNYNLRVRDTQGVFEFKNRNFRCMNPSNPANGTEMILHDTGGDYRLRIGSTTTATVGIGRQYNASYHLTVGGTSNFNETRVENDATFLGQQLLSTDGRIFQRADVNNSLNVISTEEINFSLQSNRTTDPTTGTIALQLNDTNGITINRAVTNHQTFNSIGNIVGEADVVSWGRFMFQNSSELKEVLDTQYKLYIRNGDTAGEMNLTIGLENSTPEIQLTDGKVNLLGNLEITHVDVSGSQRVLINNPDTDGFIRLSNNNLSRLDATNTGVDVYGFFTTTNNADIGGNLTCVALTETSDAKLKENIKEVNTKECYKAVKYIKPKTYNFINDESKKSNIGFVADDIKDAKMPKEWDNIIYYNDDGMKLLAYNKTTVVLWGCVRQLMEEVEDLKKEVKKLKGEESPKAKAKAKEKSKN